VKAAGEEVSSGASVTGCIEGEELDAGLRVWIRVSVVDVVGRPELCGPDVVLFAVISKSASGEEEKVSFKHDKEPF